jgi:hypothetical protein
MNGASQSLVSSPELSVVMPVFNEAGAILASFRATGNPAARAVP